MSVTRGAIAVAAALLLAARVAQAIPEYILGEQTVPGSVTGAVESTEYAYQPPAPVRAVYRLGEFLREGALDLKLRNYYFHRARDGQPNYETWAQGGALAGETPRWRDRLRLGATLYTSQKLYGPADKDGSRLLRPGQKSFTVLGQLWLDARLYGDLTLRLYRQGFRLPYLNGNDTRMVPNTFESVALGDVSGRRFVYGFAHTWRMKPRDADRFISMTEAAGIDGPDRAVTSAGARLTLADGANIGVVNHYGRDYLNTFYSEFNSRTRPLRSLGLQASAQFTRQRSVGEELGGDIDTHTWGARLAASYDGVVLSLAHTVTDDNDGIQSPWGGKPSYLSLMIRDFDRAGEEAWLLGLSSDFRWFGDNAFSGFLNVARGHTPDNGGIATPDEAELDLTLDYKPATGLLKGLWIRLRGAFVNEDGSSGVDLRDVRLIINYAFPLHTG